MADSQDLQPNKERLRQQNWAAPVDRLNIDGLPENAVNLNVSGRHLTNPLDGFGQMWQKTYRVRFDGVQVDPREIVRVWKEKFPTFWPKNNHFYGRSGIIQPGETAVLNLAGPGGMTAPGGNPVISTGIYVIYADEDSFSFLTPQGHMFAGMNTFSAYEENGVVYAQNQALIRAGDPFYEISFRLGFGHKMEDDFWTQTLHNLAAYFGADSQPTLERVLVDSRLQWSKVANVRHNAAVRTFFYLLSKPFRWIGRKVSGKKK